MIATIIYPKEVCYSFNVPCVKGDETNILPYVFQGTTPWLRSKPTTLGLRSLCIGDLILVERRWFRYCGFSYKGAKWLEITEEQAINIQTKKEILDLRSAFYTETNPFKKSNVTNYGHSTSEPQ